MKILRLILPAISLMIAQAMSGQWLTNGTSIYYNGGRVGIGTSAPSNALHVVDPVNQGVGIFQNPNERIVLGVDGSGGYLQSDGINFSFFAGSKRVLFGSSANGHVGIGTTTPFAPLTVFGGSTTDTAVYGLSDHSSGTGVFGGVTAGGTNTSGVYGVALGSGKGVLGFSEAGVGVQGRTGTGLAGHFQGNVQIIGSVSKSSGTFKIDHPLDPENKYLYHSFVESPDMMNIYKGNVVLDASGSAVVTMPAYFEALNREFGYQLTCLGGYSPVYVASKIAGNQFVIAGGQAGLEVSWHVTGTRQDKYAEMHRVQVEEDKPAEDRGFYLHPEAFGKSTQQIIPSLRVNASVKEKFRSRE